MSEPGLDADIELLPTDAGGRRREIRTGYRPALWFGETGPSGEPELHSVVIALKHDGTVYPGQSASVRVTPVAFETWPAVRWGTRFDLFDSGRPIGRGTLRSALPERESERELRNVLHRALEDWAIEQFRERITRTEAPSGDRRIDLSARFSDDAGDAHLLIGEIVGRRPTDKDVKRLAGLMAEHSASLGLIMALDEPTAAALNCVYEMGRVALPGNVWAPRVRILTPRDLRHGAIELLPTRRAPDALELVTS